MDNYKKEGIDLVYLKVEQRASPPTPSGCGLTDKILRIKTNMLKTFIVGLGIVGLLGGLAANRDTIMDFFSNSAEVIIETQTIVEVQTIDSLADRIKTAQDGAQDAIEASAQGLYDDWVEKENQRIEDEIKIEYIAEVEATIEDPAY